MVEFALILFPLLLLVVGIIQFGIGLNYWLDMQRIANQGARWAAVNNWPPDCPRGSTSCDRTPEHAPGDPPAADAHGRTAEQPDDQVQVCYPDGTKLARRSGAGPDQRAPFDLLPILGVGSLSLKAKATMRLEHTQDPLKGGLITGDVPHMFVRRRAKGFASESGQVVVLFALLLPGVLRARRDRPGHRQLVRPQATSPDAGRRRGARSGAQLHRLLP